MKKDFNFISEDDNSEDVEFIPDFDENDDDCPYLSIIASIALNDKPFGILWPTDKMKEFLKSRGYRILNRKNKDTNEDYELAIKPNSNSIPDDGHSNMKEAFDSEMQDIILKWVLRIAKENDDSSKS